MKRDRRCRRMVDSEVGARIPWYVWAVASLLLVTVMGASAGGILSATLNAEKSTLTIRTARGAVQAPMTEEQQEGFDSALVAPDQSAVGWLAEVANCCTSYPLPMAVVIFDGERVIQRFSEGHPIFRWNFVGQGDAVAYMASWPHGFVPQIYKVRRIADGKVLEEFVCSADEKTWSYVWERPVPDWVWPLAEGSGCPESE